MSDYPSVLYVATPYALCFGALINEKTVMTDARCLYPFQDQSETPSEVQGVLAPKYLMVAAPTVNVSTIMHNIQLSIEVYTNVSQAGYRASTFMGMVGTYVDNSTFYAVNTSAVHAYYPQSQYVDSAEQNFDVGIVTLMRPIDGADTALLQLDDLDANVAGLSALTFSPSDTTNDAAAQQKLYQGIDLTKARKTDVSSLSRSNCDTNYMDAFGLKNMKSFDGHSLPNNGSPIYCSSMYDNTTKCSLDTSIRISDSASDINSVDLNSTLFFVTSGSQIRLVSVGLPHLFEVQSGSSDSCKSNGFVYFPRTGLYTDWLGWVTSGSFSSSGTWTDKPLPSSNVAEFVNGGCAGGILPSSIQTAFIAAMVSVLASFSIIL
ncbi:hypothetical protein EV178_001064 [Coemansia sp. RSA 1646]|nr:hypothetical protein EV178_001064 [Coemansia sp. RSA 1646]KAJ1772195.1 hypothetical protein LPJ74_001625 [Coemansia sp. RSA 1843]KAJ2091827.1 hypothetical protein IW138_001516 [Coemansia sp. RSA 986]